MIKFNRTNGHIEIGDILVFPEFSLSEIGNLEKLHKLVKTVVNDGYISYSIPDVGNGEFSLYLIFYLERLYSLSVSLGGKYQFPPWKITEAEVNNLQQRLDAIGGKGNYNWGDIGLSEDKKAGVASILIEYYKGVYFHGMHK